MSDLNKLNDIDLFSLEEVAFHSKADNSEGVAIRTEVAVKLVATGHALFKECPYIQYLKHSNKYSGVILTSKGRKVASEKDITGIENIIKDVTNLIQAETKPL